MTEPGIIVTGVPRSGTTLAYMLRSSLTEDALFDAYEPDTIHPHIGHCRIAEAEKSTREAIAKYGIVKLPELAFVLPHFEPVYDVTLTFRDFRLFLPSVLEHRNASSVTGAYSCWRQYAGGPKLSIEQVGDLDEFDRAFRYFQTAYLSALHYTGPMAVWNYGFWEEWEGHPDWVQHSPVVNGMSGRILDNLGGEAAFSDASFSLDIWEQFKAKYGIQADFEARIDELHLHLKKKYATRGFVLKTLDDK